LKHDKLRACRMCGAFVLVGMFRKRVGRGWKKGARLLCENILKMGRVSNSKGSGDRWTPKPKKEKELGSSFHEGIGGDI